MKKIGHYTIVSLCLCGLLSFVKPYYHCKNPVLLRIVQKQAPVYLAPGSLITETNTYNNETITGHRGNTPRRKRNEERPG
jgi:hypothetical protein